MAIIYDPANRGDLDLVEAVDLLNKVVTRYYALKANFDQVKGRTFATVSRMSVAITSIDQILPILNMYISPIKHIEEQMKIRKNIRPVALAKIKALIAEHELFETTLGET